MKKIYLIPMLAFFGIALAFAGVYVVNSLNLTVGVEEPFTVQYAVIGDAGTYTTGTCDDESLSWFTSESTSIPTGNFYPLESRAVCVKITNAGEVTIPYVVSAVVTNDNTEGDCAEAFNLPDSFTGNAVNGDNYNGVVVQIAADATPVSGCNVKIDVARGTLE